MTAARIMIIEDGIPQSKTLAPLVPDNLKVLWSDGGGSAAADSFQPQVIVLHSGAEAPARASRHLELIRRWSLETPVLFVTSCSSEEMAVTALRHGVKDYFTHPLESSQLWASVRRWACRAPGCGAVVERGTELVGNSPAMTRLKAEIFQVASSPSNVLITGETGTGKELVARLLHEFSPRRKQPFVCVNAAAIPDELFESELFGHERGAFTGADAQRAGKLELAEGGTLLLDEIGNMTRLAQAKILRALESREFYRVGGRRPIFFNVRLLAATNQDLGKAVQARGFRDDLYYRVNVIQLNLPPLRKRKEDIPGLIDHFIKQFNDVLGRQVEGIAPEALHLLTRSDWPGNIRELRNVVEAAFARQPQDKEITLSDLPDHVVGQLGAGSPTASSEKDRLLDALIESRWNKTEAAERLCWSRMTVYRKMAFYRMDRNPFKAANREPRRYLTPRPAGQ